MKTDLQPSRGIADRRDAGSRTPRPDVSILIVGFNSAACIADCISAIAPACTRYGTEVLLIDNGDGATEALVAAQFPDVTIVPGRGNIGFAAGNNLLARHARADFYLLLNPDMVLTEGAIDALMDAALRHAQASAWGGVSLGLDGKPDTGNAIAIPTLRELFTVAMGRSAVGSRPVAGLAGDAQVDVLMGGLVLFAKSAWEAAEGLDERYFLYCEEVDLFHRLGRMGHTFWRVAQARGIHDAAHGRGYSPTRQLYRVAGIMEFARCHWGPGRRAIAAVLLWLAALERYVAGKILARWRPRLRALGESNRIVALRPRCWLHGYDAERGLLVRLAATTGCGKNAR